MKGARLFIIALLTAVVVLALILGSFKSWSDSDGSTYEPALKLLLSCLFVTLFIISFTHKLGFRLMANWTIWKFPLKLRLRHIDRVAGFLFMGVMAFGVNEYEFWHFVFIIAAAAVMVFRTYKYYDDITHKTIAIVGLSLAVFAWIGGLILPNWSIGVGELVFFMVSAIVVITDIKQIETE